MAYPTEDCPKCEGHGWLHLRSGGEIECPECVRGQVEVEEAPVWAMPTAPAFVLRTEPQASRPYRASIRIAGAR